MSMKTYSSRFVVFAIFAIVPVSVFADYAAVIASPVNHPVSIRPATLTQHMWRNNSGAWGETLINETYKLQGFDEVFAIKRLGDQGIDHLAVKYDSTGKLVDVRFGETKTHFGGRAELSTTSKGKQLSKKDLADKFQTMKNSGDPRVKELIHDIHRFRKERGLSMESFVQRHTDFHDLNTRTGRYVLRDPITRAPLSNDSIEHSLKRVQKTTSSQPKGWAKRSLSQLDDISKTSMTSALGRQSTARRSILRRSSKSSLRRVVATAATASQSLRRVAARVAGPIGFAVALAMDTHEIYSHLAAYKRGDMNRRDMVIAVSRSGGGILGASAGAAGGAWLGASGGPFAWVTVPLFAIIGGGVGYFAGSVTTGAIAHAFYSSVDEKVKKEVDRWIIGSTYMQVTN